MEEYKIKQSDIDSVNVKSAPDNLKGDPKEIKNIFDKLPELIADKFNKLVDNLYSKAQVDNLVNNKVVEIGTGDMAKAMYDRDNDGVVDDSAKLGGNLPEYYATAAAVQTAQTTADTANTTANAAMPKSGGIFGGDVAAYSENRATSCLRNIEVRITDTSGALQPTDKIIMVRK